MSDAWRYCDNLSDPEAIKLLVQAAMTANATIHFAKRRSTPKNSAPCQIGQPYSANWCKPCEP